MNRQYMLEEFLGGLRKLCMDGDTYECLIPGHIVDELDRYVNSGTETGRFLHMVLCNDLHGAIIWADPAAIACLKPLMMLIHNYTPGCCWGDEGRVATWWDTFDEFPAVERCDVCGGVLDRKDPDETQCYQCYVAGVEAMGDDR